MTDNQINQFLKNFEVSTCDNEKFFHTLKTLLQKSNISPKHKVKNLLPVLSDDERMNLFYDYCLHCGCDDPDCQRWNDE